MMHDDHMNNATNTAALNDSPAITAGDHVYYTWACDGSGRALRTVVEVILYDCIAIDGVALSAVRLPANWSGRVDTFAGEYMSSDAADSAFVRTVSLAAMTKNNRNAPLASFAWLD